MSDAPLWRRKEGGRVACDVSHPGCGKQEDIYRPEYEIKSPEVATALRTHMSNGMCRLLQAAVPVAENASPLSSPQIRLFSSVL